MAKKELTKEEIRTKAVSEAERYLNNAKESLAKTEIDDKLGCYKDVKYTKTAYGTIYSGVLLVLDAFIAIKGESKPLTGTKRKSIEYYRDNVYRDGVLFSKLELIYQLAHLNGYYEGTTAVKHMKYTMETYKEIVERFKVLTK